MPGPGTGPGSPQKGRDRAGNREVNFRKLQINVCRTPENIMNLTMNFLDHYQIIIAPLLPHIMSEMLGCDFCKVICHVDSKSLVDSLHSSNKVEDRRLRKFTHICKIENKMG